MDKNSIIKINNLEVVPSPPLQYHSPLRTLNFAESQSLFLRDSEVVIFRRQASPLWQCRFKQQNGTWDRVSTKQASIKHAVRIAFDLYDKARFRQRLGLAQRAPMTTLKLLENKTDIRTLAKQMGNSAVIIERHFSKLTPTMAAEHLA